MDAHSTPTSPIRLGLEPPFDLGVLHITPATRQVAAGDQSQTIEPRVMQVLVLLGRAAGEVVTREELVDRCWGGVIVGENALNRVISLVRQIAATFADGSFSIETIPKIGYRLTVVSKPRPVTTPALTGSAQGPDQLATGDGREPAVPRRRVLIGGAFLAAAGAGLSGLWLANRPHRPPREAVELYKRAELAQRQGLGDQAEQAVSYYQRAVAIDPNYAAAWGGLALAQRHMFDGFGGAEATSLPPMIRSAAERALALDPDNVDAQLALILINRFYGNWAQMETAMRRLTIRYPTHWLAQGQFAMLLYEVGRWKEGIEYHRKALAIDPFLPVGHAALANALSAAGRLQEAEVVFEEGRRKWPKHPFLWITRYSHLIYTGRPAAALSFALDPDVRPTGLPEAFFSARVALAQALEAKDPQSIARVVELHRNMAEQSETSIPMIAPILALLGRPDLSLAATERYFLNTGDFGKKRMPLQKYERRYTSFLFVRPMIAISSHPTYRMILDRIGLERYWRISKHFPDFRS